MRDGQLKARLTATPGDGAESATARRSTACRQLRGMGQEPAVSVYESARASVFCSVCSRWHRKPASPRAISARGSFSPCARSATRRWPGCAALAGRQLLKLQHQIRRADERRERERRRLSQQKMQTAVSIGSSILGALLGRKPSRPRISVGSGGGPLRRSLGPSNPQDVDRAEEDGSMCSSSRSRIPSVKWQPKSPGSRPRSMRLPSAAAGGRYPARKADVAVGEVALVWTPWRKGADGFPAPAYD